MTELSEIDDLSTICRVCLEKASKMYPLIGPIVNVDIDVAAMISCCIGEEIKLCDDLPKGVCVPCFRTIRIAYNFVVEFREADKKLQNFKQLISNELEEEVQDDLSNDFLSNEPVMTKLEYLNQSYENQDEITYEHIIKTEDDSNTEYMEDIFNSVSNVIDPNEEETLELLHEKSDETLELEEKQRTSKPSLRRKATVRFYECPICLKKITKFNAVFLPHLYSHKDESFNCTLCEDMSGLDLDSYISHFKQLHLYQCTVCNKSFDNKSTHSYHLRLHMESKVYACSYKNCTKKFINSWSLKKHMNTHSKLAKYICSKCGRKFNTYDTFRYHLKTHDGKRNHLCPECGRSFLQSVHLKYHMWTHTGVKQFHCKKCDKSYTSVTQLKKHLRKYCGFDEANQEDSKND